MTSGAEERRTSTTQQVRFMLGDEESHDHEFESGIDEPLYVRPRKHRHRALRNMLPPQPEPEPIVDAGRFDSMQLDDD